ncbi:MAG: PDZ domain-containing protein, partial [Pseudomonadales bacterium]|nr:PDZ domain-containing protein [Pseudomonadales bacterium]
QSRPDTIDLQSILESGVSIAEQSLERVLSSGTPIVYKTIVMSPAGTVAEADLEIQIEKAMQDIDVATKSYVDSLSEMASTQRAWTINAADGAKGVSVTMAPQLLIAPEEFATQGKGAFLGITMVSGSSEYVEVASVIPDSGAQSAGIKTGDRILSIGPVRLDSFNSPQQALVNQQGQAQDRTRRQDQEHHRSRFLSTQSREPHSEAGQRVGRCRQVLPLLRWAGRRPPYAVLGRTQTEAGAHERGSQQVLRQRFGRAGAGEFSPRRSSGGRRHHGNRRQASLRHAYGVELDRARWLKSRRFGTSGHGDARRKEDGADPPSRSVVKIRRRGEAGLPPGSPPLFLIPLSVCPPDCLSGSTPHQSA